MEKTNLERIKVSEMDNESFSNVNCL